MTDTHRTTDASTDFDKDLAHLLTIKELHSTYRLLPSHEGYPMWQDCLFLLRFIDKLWKEYSRVLNKHMDAQSPEPCGEVLGDRLPMPLWQFEQRAQRLLTDEQAKVLPDNSLIGFICDAVLLARENESLSKAPLPTSGEPRDEHMARFRVYEEDLLPPGPLLKGQTEVWLATAQPPTKPEKQDCPHAAPFRYCQQCIVDPCPIGLGKENSRG